MISNISKQIRSDLDVNKIRYAHKDLDGFAELSGERTIIFLEPVLKIINNQEFSSVYSVEGQVQRDTDAVRLLRNWVRKLGGVTQAIPLMCGFFSYEFLHSIEKIARPGTDAYGIPSYLFYLYKKILFVEEQIQIYSIEYVEFDHPFWEMQSLNSRACEKVRHQQQTQRNCNKMLSHELSQLEQYSNFSGAEYIEAVDKIKERILDGLVYQVNLSQQFILPFYGDSFEFYLNLKEISPAKKSAFINVIEEKHAYSVISSSPELFIKGDYEEALSSPIKGTRPRGEGLEEDERLKMELISSQKDLAELAMIVDLIRNDMGKIAEIGSVRVMDFPRLESYAQVHHLVADVVCKLKPGTDFLDVLCAVFPCGSISGCPKVAALEIISELERTQRGIYTGSIGFIGGSGIYDFSVAIRTVLVRDSLLIFQAGGGIVIDSDSRSEYAETLAKAKGIFLAWQASR